MIHPGTSTSVKTLAPSNTSFKTVAPSQVSKTVAPTHLQHLGRIRVRRVWRSSRRWWCCQGVFIKKLLKKGKPQNNNDPQKNEIRGYPKGLSSKEDKITKEFRVKQNIARIGVVRSLMAKQWTDEGCESSSPGTRAGTVEVVMAGARFVKLQNPSKQRFQSWDK